MVRRAISAGTPSKEEGDEGDEGGWRSMCIVRLGSQEWLMNLKGRQREQDASQPPYRTIPYHITS